MSGYKWVKESGVAPLLPNSVKIGLDKDNVQLVVARALHNGDDLPGKGKPEHGITYVCYNGYEFAKRDYEILLQQEFSYLAAKDGLVPSGAVAGGKTKSGETLYIGRTLHNGIAVGGKIHPSHGVLYVPYNGKEYAYKEYEALVLN